MLTQRQNAFTIILSIICCSLSSDVGAKTHFPTSKNFTVRAEPSDYVGVVQSWVFPFSSKTGSTLKSVKIVSLPSSFAGRLVLETRYKPPKRPTFRSVTAGQVIPNDVTRTRTQGKPFLFFHASGGLENTSFKFRVIDSHNIASAEYRAFILLPRPISEDFTVEALPGDVTALIQSVVFPLNDKYGRTLLSLTIGSLPDPLQGKLWLHTRYKPPVVPTKREVAVDEVIPSDVTKTREQGKPFLYFVATSGFSQAHFYFSVQVDDDQESQGSYTATLVAPPTESNTQSALPLSFGDETIGELRLFKNGSLNKTLPEAAGGVGDLTYSLSPALPAGLTFNASTRTVSGTVTVVQAVTAYTYKVADENNQELTITFNITVKLPTSTEPPDTEDSSDSPKVKPVEVKPPVSVTPPVEVITPTDPEDSSDSPDEAPVLKSPDFDNDGDVDFTDFLLFVAVYGTSQGDNGYDEKYDLDSSGTINVADHRILVSNFGIISLTTSP